jgi:thioredoxin 1
MMFKGGKVEATQIGAVGKGQITQMIDKLVQGGPHGLCDPSR